MPDDYTKLLMHFDQECLNEADYGTKYPTGGSRSVMLMCDNNGPFLGTSYYLDYMASYDLSYATSSDWNITGQDFAIDFFIKFLTTSTSATTYIDRYASSFTVWEIGFGSTTGLVFKSDTTILSQGSMSGWALDTWYHVAITRTGGTEYKAYRDGVLLMSNSSSSSVINTSAGALNLKAAAFDSRLANVRLSIGTPRWTSNFTKPASYHVKDSYTKFLVTFVSDNVKRHSVINTATVNSWDLNNKKFGVASRTMSGSGGKITIGGNAEDFQFGTGDFTIDFWTHVSITGSTALNLLYFDSSEPTLVIRRLVTGSKLQILIAGVVVLECACTSSTWYHYALTRQGTTLRLFENGILAATVTDSSNYTGAASISLGAPNGATYFFTMDELRVSKGIARWTSNFVTPTGPYEDYKLSGNASVPCTLTILNDATKVVEEERQVQAGAWTISPLTNNKKIIMAKLDDGETICYGEVWPVPE